MSKDEKKSKIQVPTKIDTRFVVGLFLIIFLVLINSYVKDIPWFLVAIPAFFMGFDVTELVREWRRPYNEKNKS